MDKKDERIRILEIENAKLKVRISLLEAELHRTKFLDPSIPIVITLPKGFSGEA